MIRRPVLRTFAVAAVIAVAATNPSCQKWGKAGSSSGSSSSGGSSSIGSSLHGWPGQDNTGPSKYALANGHWTTSNGMTITHSGTYKFIHFTGSVDIEAKDVTLVDDTVVTTDDIANITIGADNAVISRVTISGTDSGSGRCEAGIKDKGGSASYNSTISRVNVYWCSTGVQDIAGVLEDSYIHDPGYKPLDHLNGETQNGSETPLKIIHNFIYNNSPQGQTDAVALFCDFGTEGNVTVADNYLDGGGYAFYGGNSGNEATSSDCAAAGHAPHNIIVTGNTFGTHSADGTSAYYISGYGNEWSGNVSTDGKPIN